MSEVVQGPNLLLMNIRRAKRSSDINDTVLFHSDNTFQKDSRPVVVPQVFELDLSKSENTSNEVNSRPKEIVKYQFTTVMFGSINIVCLIDAKLMGVSLSVVPLLIRSAGYVLLVRKHQTKWTKQQHSLARQAQKLRMNIWNMWQRSRYHLVRWMKLKLIRR